MKQYIFPPIEGWEKETWYLVEISFKDTNPVHQSLFYSGYLNGGDYDFKTNEFLNLFPGSYNMIINPSYEYAADLKDVYFLRVIKKLISLSSIKNKIIMPDDRIKELESNVED